MNPSLGVSLAAYLPLSALKSQEIISPCVCEQGVVTSIGAVLTAETGDMTRSPGHQRFFPFGHGVTTVIRDIS